MKFHSSGGSDSSRCQGLLRCFFLNPFGDIEDTNEAIVDIQHEYRVIKMNVDRNAMDINVFY